MSASNIKSVEQSDAMSAIKSRLKNLESRSISVVDKEYTVPETFKIESVANAAFINLVRGLECFAQKDVAVISATDSVKLKSKVNKPK